MRSRASAFWVGAFVLAGLVAGVAAVLAFGSGRLFRDTVRYVMFFEGAVNGLQEGAPVTFKGVKVGSVTDIAIAVGSDDQVRIPVYIELDPASIRGRNGPDVRDVHERMDQLVELGLRAQLELQSLVTGQLMVQLDFFPDEPPRLAGGDLSLPELPTKRSGLQRLSESFQQIDIRAIAERMLNALEGIDAIVNSGQVREGVANAAATLQDLRAITAELKASTGPMASEIRQTSASLRELIEQLNQRVGPILAEIEKATEESRQLVAGISTSVEQLTPQVQQGVQAATGFMEHAGRQLDLEQGPAAALVANLTKASGSLESTLQQTRQTLTALEASAGPGSPLQAEMVALLPELREAVRSLRELTDYLQRHPEALLRGKGKPEKED
jgi:paraquat-inducible protein B